LNEPQGCATNTITGVIGAALGGWLSTLIGGRGFAGADFWSIIIAIIGAIILLAIVRAIRNR